MYKALHCAEMNTLNSVKKLQKFLLKIRVPEDWTGPTGCLGHFSMCRQFCNKQFQRDLQKRLVILSRESILGLKYCTCAFLRAKMPELIASGVSRSRARESILIKLCSLSGPVNEAKERYRRVQTCFYKEVSRFEKTLMLGKIEGRRRGYRGWDGWMASPTQWTWVWVDSGGWWWTRRPGMLRFMRSQRAGHDWATELKLNWRSQRSRFNCNPCHQYIV